MLTIPSPVLKFAGTSCPMDARLGVSRPAEPTTPILVGVISRITRVRANVFVVANERRELNWQSSGLLIRGL